MIMKFTDVSYMLSDVWNLYKKYAVRTLDDAELKKFSDEVEDIYNRYKTPFAKDIILAVISEIERSVKFFEKGKSK